MQREMAAAAAAIASDNAKQRRQIKAGELSVEEATKRNFVLAKYVHNKILY